MIEIGSNDENESIEIKKSLLGGVSKTITTNTLLSYASDPSFKFKFIFNIMADEIVMKQVWLNNDCFKQTLIYQFRCEFIAFKDLRIKCIKKKEKIIFRSN